jgi:ABC-type branched-subunit amino acid transport system permease subunit
MVAARRSSWGVAWAAVRDGVPMVKHSGCLVSPSKAKKVCTTLAALAVGSLRCLRIRRLL